MNRQLERLHTARSHRTSGFALLSCMIFLALAMLVGVRAMQSASLDERMAGNALHRGQAFEAAESALVLAARESLTVTGPDAPANVTGYTVADGRICRDDEGLSCRVDTKAAATRVTTTSRYRAASANPPPGYSLDGPFISRHFTITADARHGPSRVRLERGFRRLGPSPGP